MSGDTVYTKNLFLLTLKGQITVQFADGSVLEGEFLTQDELNIFIEVDNAPLMIPRSQVKYLKGQPGQPIESDNSQSALPPPAAVPKEAAALPPELIETGQLAVFADETGEERTTVFDQAAIAAELAAPTAFQPPYTGPIAAEEENDEDPTLVFKQKAALMVEDLEETTPLPEEAQAISAYLECIAGPHTGEVFMLTDGAITLGRASDNAVSLSKDKEISRKHSKISYESGNFIIEDQNSLNGTLVNNVRVDSPRYLEEGDVILIGVSTLVYHQK